MARRKDKKQQIRPRYCDTPGVTNEHVFACSFSDLFAGQGTFRLDYEHPELGVRVRPRRAPKLMIKSRKFCGGCNNGWMNRIDQGARRLLRALCSTLGRRSMRSTSASC